MDKNAFPTKVRTGLIGRLFSGSWRDLVVLTAPVLLVLGLIVWAGVRSVRLAPPNTIRMISGLEGSTYRSNAEKYKKIIEKLGVKVEILPSKGSLDNLRLLTDPKFKADVAFIQGGLIEEGMDISRLVSLGTVFVQPLMVYYRSSTPIDVLSQLRGKRLAVGPEGSGTHALTMKLLKANDIDEKSATLRELGGEDAAKALEDGEVDAAFLAGDSVTPKIQRRLRATPGISLMSFRQAEAYRRRMHYLVKLTYPQGAGDFAKNIPPQDTQLVGPSVELVARNDLHPALSDLLVKAAQEIHGGAGMYREAGEYPSPHEREFPISADATRYYKTGSRFFYRHLPFWLASMADRLVVLLVPLLVLLVPATKSLPALYRWRVRSRIYRWYGALMAIEREMLASPTPETQLALRTRIGDIERAVNQLKMPPAYADQLYVLRDHVAMVSRRLQAQSAA
jgi:TRAP transporter TAXI family solute receptor